MAPEQMEALIRSMGRQPRQRTTLYASVSPERYRASFSAPTLRDIIKNPARRYERGRARRPLLRPGIAPDASQAAAAEPQAK